MKAIILAAGQGKRLMPLTRDCPKCMVKYNGKPIIDYIISAFYNVGLNDVTVVTGYKNEILKKHLAGKNIKFYHNALSDKSNMVYSLFCAEREFNDDILISYSDIIFRESILQNLLRAPLAFNVGIDKDWLRLWKIRMENPLEDAETLKLNSSGKILEIGKKANSFSEIEGQYIGLVYIGKQEMTKVKGHYYNLDRDKLYDGKDYNNIFMTSFIQSLIDNNIVEINPVFINGGWLEIDSISDLENYSLQKYMI